MRTRNVLLAAFLAALVACQPETPKQPEESAMPSAGAMQGETAAVPSAMTGAAEPATKPVTPAPVAQTSKAATAVAVKPVAVAPSPVPAPVQDPVVEAKSSGVLSEADALALAKKSKCLVCHALDKKLVGPSWRDVAAKYSGDAGAEARLMDKIAKGGKGAWGVIAMPASPQVNEGDRRRLVQFILSLK
jgi:cytochrome c